VKHGMRSGSFSAGCHSQVLGSRRTALAPCLLCTVTNSMGLKLRAMALSTSGAALGLVCRTAWVAVHSATDRGDVLQGLGVPASVNPRKM
jgi:hypothetical protein